jgi:hypothetical protein
MLVDILLTVVCMYFAYRIGSSIERSKRGEMVIDNALARAAVPVIVAEEYEGHFYLYEKDTQNFICQTTNLDDIPEKLYNSKKISLALLLFPEFAGDEKFWCINGKLKTVKDT